MSEKKGLFGGLFGGKTKEETKTPAKQSCGCGCACGGNKTAPAPKTESKSEGNGMVLKVLGSCCSKCGKLEENTKTAVANLGIDAKVEHISDFAQIGAYGVMSTPALVINEKVVSYGKLLSVEEVTAFINAQ